ncbi:3-ketoacyl-CoA reductase [Irpex lacteus]|nr:3-ketoacyl-CoA reductase [Irpex lacteus]
MYRLSDFFYAASALAYLQPFILAVGAFTFLKFAVKTIGVLLQTFVLPGKSLKKYGAGKGAWAVVTGASEGIGREYALQLAKKGFNVLVAARNKTALDALVKEIEAQGAGVKAKAVQFDFSKVHEPAKWAAFRTELEHLDVGVLVNNVGKSHAFPTDFVDTTEEEVDNILTINIDATLKVTRAVLPGMVQRKRGLVLILTSFAGNSSVSPMLAPYAASKVFLSSFSAALGPELKSKGVDVEAVNTYFVVSSMSKIRRASVLIPTPKQFVRASLSKIGLAGGALFTGRPYLSTPYWSHAVLDYFIHVLGWASVVSNVTHNMHISIRARALKKLAREAKQQ